MSIVRNIDQIATSSLRRDALAIVEAAYTAIDTEQVIHSKMSLEGDVLRVDDRSYDLSAFERVKVFGVGKASCKAVQTIESILKEHISSGLAIDVRGGICDIVEVVKGTQPRPSPENVAVSGRMVDMANDCNEKDLVIVVVSGGGSSLLCWPIGECEQGGRFFDEAERSGMTIEEMNVVRRHLSSVKGGGLAAMLHLSTVIGLIFCDVPGDYFADVASGPTYFDASTITDAQAILDRYHLEGYTLGETPKDAELFDRVHNVQMVSNTKALDAMRERAQELGYESIDAGSDINDDPKETISALLALAQQKTAVIGGGETVLKVVGNHGKGGRCQYLALEALKMISQGDVFVPFASDGIDNCDAAGVIVDDETRAKAKVHNLSIDAALESFNTYDFFETTGDLFFTGTTDANVSDLYILLRG